MNDASFHSFVRLVSFAGLSLTGCLSSDLLDRENNDDLVRIEDKPCNDNDTRECGLEQGVMNGKLTCGVGLQFCHDGIWSGCYLDPAKGKKHLPAPGPARVFPLTGTLTQDHTNLVKKLLVTGGAASTCDNNPCNPYCWIYSDTPVSPYAADTATITLPYNASVQVLSNSNISSIYKAAGSNSDACSSNPNSACQFDQHCVTNSESIQTCTAFDISDQNSCTGVDITVAPTCNDNTNSPILRAISVCNRGSIVTPAGVQCYTFPSNTSVTMGTISPDLSNAVYLGATSAPIDPGTCTTIWVDNTGGRSCSNNAQCGSGICDIDVCEGNANFHLSATQLVVCNPQNGGSVVTTIPSAGGYGPTASSNVTGVWKTTEGSSITTNLAAAVDIPFDDKVVITTPNFLSTNIIHFGNFGFSLPENATVNAIRTTVRWKMQFPLETSNMNIQMYTAGGNNAIGVATSFNSSSIPITFTTTTQSVTGLQLTPNQLANEQFIVKMHISR